VITFLNGVVGQAYQMVANARVNVNFYSDLLGIYAEDSAAENLGKHTSRFL
jgi:hypothetical protein